ncbi:ABC transporter ATP-binding protein [Desulfococcaceae bacterium HSG7]|nr:ABC transporter ATP-binding protein [Desulfococcaceae bacterium HSG7]
MLKSVGEAVEFNHVSMRYPGTESNAVTDANVHIKAGEFFSFLGPSGCGKTTLLRLVSGFLDPTEGEVRIGGKDMRGIGPNKRPTAMIFQNLALFPLMSVAQNIGFGLEVRGVSKTERMKKAVELLELVDLPGVENKMVGDLSGGQMQRVAIARGLAVEPAVLLLDEPLSALDLKLRQHMRTELRKIQRRTGVTFVYITHDQGEALTMSDRVGVMTGQGVIDQIATADQLYNEPQTAFVADFVGENNAFAGTVTKTDGDYAILNTESGSLKGLNRLNLNSGQKAIAFVRPEAILLAEDSTAVENILKFTVRNLSFEGSFITVFLDTPAGQTCVMKQNNDGSTPLMQTGTEIKVCFSAENTQLLSYGEVSYA